MTLEATCALTAALPPEAERASRGAACAQLAVLYSTGEAGEVNHEKAYRLRDHACRLGNSGACVLAGAALASGDGTGRAADQAAAYAIYTKACEAKQAEGCLRVGAAHHRGEGAEKSPAAALRAFLKACELGNAAGCFNAGTMEEAGEGIEAASGDAAPSEAGAPKSTSDAARYAKATLHYGMACSGGFPSACYNLALVYDRGVITQERPEWAAELYRRGCDAHHPGACGGLGGLLYTGRGIAQDTTRGHELMQDSCAKGSDWGCRLIRKHVGNK
ncbi:MAG: sel1 repeat family protein [Polyangiaceae bacterium]|nr:sel1 repeat family protein [Polyangiaceae bacterium]MCW5789859.1 sel1 repeat family protein [Polyangiaceae bacterium]